MQGDLVDELIAAFGCKTQAAFGRLLETSTQAVNNWKRDGLPDSRWRQIYMLAQKSRVKLPARFFDMGEAA